MRRFLVSFLLANAVFAVNPTIGFFRSLQYGPQTVYPGHAYFFYVTPMPVLHLSCRASDSTCADTASTPYVPSGSEDFVLSDQNLTAGGPFPNPPTVYNGIFYGPHYKPVNVGVAGPGRFNLAMFPSARSNNPQVVETNYLASTGGSPAGAVPLCADGVWPHSPDASKLPASPGLPDYGLTFGIGTFGATHFARFQATTVNGQIVSTAMIDGGANFTTTPTYATSFKCNDASGTMHLYNNVPIAGAVVNPYVPITSDGTLTMFLKSGAAGVTRPFLQNALTNPPGVGWPAGTTMTYWSGGTSYSTVTLLKTAPLMSGTYMTWNPSLVSDGLYMGVRVFIPASAPLGGAQRGWTFCQDTLGNGCVTMTHYITIAEVPSYTISQPTTVPPLPPNFTNNPQPCYRYYPLGATNAGNCGFSNLLTGFGDAVEERGYAYWWPPPVRGATAAPPTGVANSSNPDYALELNSGYAAGTPYRCSLTIPTCVGTSYTPGTCGARFVQYTDPGSFCSSPECGYFYDLGRVAYYIWQWSGDRSWLNVSRAYLSRYGQIGPGVPGVTGCAYNGTPVVGQMALPYNEQSTVPFSQNIMWAVHPWGPATNMVTFNSGKYTMAPEYQWSAEMAQVLIYSSWTMGTTPQTPGTINISVGRNGNQFADVGNGILTSGMRWSTFTADTKNQLAKILYPTRRTWCGCPNDGTLSSGSGSMTDIEFQFQTARELMDTVGLMLLNPAPGGPNDVGYDIGPPAEQEYFVGTYLESMIDLYDITHDPVELGIIKSTVDYIRSWYNWGVPGGPNYGHDFPQITANNGNYCAGGSFYWPNVGWYVNPNGGDFNGLGPGGWCADDQPLSNRYSYTTLNGSVAYAAAWVWARLSAYDSFAPGSGQTYVDFADATAVDSAAYDVNVTLLTGGPITVPRFAPKGNNESMGRWMFRYISERQLRGH